MTTAREHYVIDASGKRLGRVATEAAHHLLGKHRPDAVRHMIVPVEVTIENASKLLIDERKRGQKEYTRYSGYPGGLKRMTLQTMVAQKGYAELLKKAVYGMLPSNRLRAPRMKMLHVSE